MASMQEAIEALRLDYVSNGAEKMAADAAKVAQAQDRATSSAGKLAAANDSVTISEEKSNRARQSTETRLGSIQRKYDQVYRAQMEQARVERDLVAAQSEGLITAQRRMELLSLAAERHGLASVAVARETAAVQHQTAVLAANAVQAKAAASAHAQLSAVNDNSARFRRQNLGYQAFDIGQGLISGAPVAMIAAQQLPQIAQLYAAQGGLNALWKDAVGILGAVARAAGPWIAAAAALYGAYRLIASYSAEAALAVDDATAALAAQAAPIGSLKSSISELANLQKTYHEAIAETGRVSTDATNKIVANTKREFEAKKSLMELELKRQKAAIEAQRAEMAIAGLQLKRNVTSGDPGAWWNPFDGTNGINTRSDLESRGFADPRIGSVPFVRIPEEVSALQRTMEAIENSPAADKIKELRANLELTELGAKDLEEALKATFAGTSLMDDGTIRKVQALGTSLDAVRDRLASERMGDGSGYQQQLERELELQNRILDAETQRLKARTDAEKVAAAGALAGAQNPVLGAQRDREMAIAMRQEQERLDAAAHDGAVQRAQDRENSIRQAQEELSLVGKSASEVASLQFEYQALAELREEAARTGRAVDQDEIDAIKQKAAAIGEYAEALAAARALDDLRFDQDQLGRTEEDQRIYANLRSLGIDINSIRGQQLATEMRITEEMQKQRDWADDLKDALKGAASSFLQDLFSGRDVMESIVSLGDRFASMNFDKLVDMVSSGKGFGGLFGGAPEAKAPAVEAIGKGIGAAAAPQLSAGISSGVTNSIGSRSRFASLLVEAADKVGTSARELGAVIHFESGFNPNAMNPNGKNYGLIQFGEAERQKYAVAIGSTLETQFDAIVNFLKDRGFKPGMGLLDLYSTVNAGSPGRYNAVDGATTVAQKVDMMGSHLAAADKILGGAVRDGAKAGTQEGSASGVDSAILKLGTMTQDVPSASTPQQQQNGLGKNVMSGISAALGGFSTGYQSQNAGMGALGGALQGFAATGNIFGAVVGGIAGLLGGILGARNKVKQAQRQLEKQMAQIELLLAVGEGTGIGPVQKRMTDYLAEISKVVPLAWAAEDMALVERLQQSFNTMFIRERTDFYNALPGQMEGYSSGYGRQGSKQQGAEAVFNLREELRAMIADVRYFGEKTIELTPNTPEKAEEIAALRANLERDVAAAYEAAQKMALSFISGPEELTDVQKAIAALQGAAETLVPTLIELGMSSEDAAKAIQSQVIVAMDKLRDEFSKGLTADINSATGKGYLNDITDLLEEFENVKRDAAALGVSQVEADAWFKAMAQSVVDGAQLVGSTFDDLIKAFPQLAGVVHAFVGEIEDAGTRMKDYEDRLFAATTDTSTRAGALAAFDREAARERERVRVAEASAEELLMLERVLAAERLKIMQEFADRAAERARGYQNRAFAAGNDTSTLAGQLAAFDRAAAQERIDEIKQGGEAIRDLDKALAAERLKIQRDYAKQAAEEEKRRLDEAKSFFDGLKRSLKEFIDDLKAGAQSPLSPEARLAAAQTQFAEQYAKALTGDRDAANSLTSYASNVIDAGRDRWASSPEFQAIWNDMIAKLEALPNQVSAEQFIVDELTVAIEDSASVQVDATAVMTDTLKAAILAGPRDAAAALALYFDDIDTSLDGLLSTSEFMAGLSGMATDATLQSIFNELDINGDLSISRLESMLAAEGLTRSTLQAAIMAGPANTASTLAQYFNKLDTSVNGLLDKAELSAAIGNLATDDQIAEMMRTLDANGDGQLSQLELIKAASQGTQTNLDSNTGVIRQVADLRAIMQEKLSGTNTLLDRQLRALNDVDRQLGGSGSFQSGGFTGFGPADQYAGRVHGREYVLDAATTARIGVDRLDAMRRGRMPMYPVPIANDNGGVATLAEMRAIRAEMVAMKEELRTLTSVTAEGQDRIGNATEATVKGLKAATDETRIQGNKPRSAGSRN